jgi:hypothetical protein
MPTVRIWTLESDYDAAAIKCLANKLVAHLQLENLSIRAVGRSALPKRKIKGASLSGILRRATQNYLKQDACVIFVIDSDSPMSTSERRRQQNSLINQIERVVNDSSFAGKVFLAQAVQELEAWLLVDCLGVFCYFASKRAQYRENCRDKVSTKRSFAQLVGRYQSGNTENIVEAEIGGKGAKEYLTEFSEKILLALNPNMPRKNVSEKRYREAMSPEVAKHVDINQETLRRNNSLRYLGDVFAQFNQC